MVNESLKIDHIRLTPEIIESINHLQAGGTLFWEESPEDKYFTNETIKDILDELTGLSEFIISIYDTKIFTDNDKKYLEMQSFILRMKDYMKSFMAPVKKVS